MNNGKLMLIDGNSILNRAFYGIKGSGDELLKTSDGLYTNAIYGFLSIYFKYIEEEKPSFICVAFDLKAPTFRHKDYEGYKGKRKAMPEELVVQVPVIKEVLDAMNVSRIEMEGYEADDIIGSLSLCAEKQGIGVVIVTGDRDSFQLISSLTRVKLPVTRKGKTETEEYNLEAINNKYGIKPAQFIDVKALMGDASDNIPGVPGIGEKTALELIHSYESLDNLYENILNISKKSVKEKLEQNKELAYMSRHLATIERNIPCKWDINEFSVKPYNEDAFYSILSRLEFKSFINRLGIKQEKEVKLTVNVKRADRESLEELCNNIKSMGYAAFNYVFDKNSGTGDGVKGIAFYIDDINAMYVELSENMLYILKDIFENNEIKKYCHDIKAFLVYLKRNGINMNGLAFDTMIASYLINPSADKYPLPRIASENLNINIDDIDELFGKGKSYTPYENIPGGEIDKAAGAGAIAVFKLIEPLKQKIEENGQHELYYDIELPLINVLADMEYYGFKVNPEELKEFSAELDNKIGELENIIYELAGEKFNINSPKQLGVILFEKLGLPVLKKTKTGYSTDIEVLEELLPKHEIIKNIIEYRQLAKLKSTYIEGLLNVINPSTGRIHSSFNQTVTVTGRISSTEPNLQNIPIKLEMGRKIRKVFIPENNSFVLLDADYSQIELRILAHITDDENMIAAFKNNEDIHTSTASKVFNVPVSQMTPAIRAKAKAVNFGIVYGIGDFSLAKDLGITRKEARNYIDEYLNKYPNVKKYMHDIVESGKENGFVKTLFNRRRYLPELNSKNFTIRSFGERIAMNTPIQGSAADIIKIAMVSVYKKLKDGNFRSRLILQVHDELIIETHIDEEQAVSQILKESMENAAKLSVPLKADVKKGHNWYEAK